MDIKTFLVAFLSLLSWGIGSFFAKLATNKIGDKAVFWDMIAYAPVVITYSFIAFKNNLLAAEKTGIIYGLLAGGIGSFGLIFFYVLLTRKDASSAVPLTAIYPALTAILAFIFLKERLTLVKIIGIILSSIALILLSL